MKKNKFNYNIPILIFIYFGCFILIGSAYSFFSEKLELRGTVGFSENEEKKYNYDYILQEKWESGGYYYYHYIVNITYTGIETITGWQLNVRVPMTTEVNGCYGASECELSSTTLRITNASWNGTMENNTIVSPSFIIKTTDPNYELDVISVNFYKDGQITNPSTPDDPNPDEPNPDEPDPDDPNPDEPDPDDPNLTTSDIRTTFKIRNYWGNVTQFDLEIINESDINLTNWELHYQVPAGSKISGCWGADYVITNDTLILTALDWSQNIPSGTNNTLVGFQITTTDPAPTEIKLISFTAVDDNQEDVVIEI